MPQGLANAANELYRWAPNNGGTPDYITALDKISKTARGLGSKDNQRNKKLLAKINPDAKMVGTKLYLALKVSDACKDLQKLDWSLPSKAAAAEASRELVDVATRSGADSKEALEAIKSAIRRWNTYYEACRDLAVEADKLGKFCIALAKSSGNGAKVAKSAKNYVGSYVSGLKTTAELKEVQLKSETANLANTIASYEKEIAANPKNLSAVAALATIYANNCAYGVKEALAVLGSLRAKKVDKAVEKSAR